LPKALPVTVEPLTEQVVAVLLVNVTARLDVAIAETLPVPFIAILGKAPKLIV
jgi:hypothetical protein